MSDTYNGQKAKWEQRDFLGKGYSGEVYYVEDSINSGNVGILKKPDITNKVNPNQAGQIEREQNILEILSPIAVEMENFSVKVCKILDRSKKGTEGSPNFFIVTTRAQGQSIVDFASSYKAKGKKIPRLLLLRALYGLYKLLDTAHGKNIIWNDVKPEHLFWDMEKRVLTVIDWANGEFTEVNGVTKNGNFSLDTDYFLYIERLASFVSENDPELYAQLNWQNPKTLNRDPSTFPQLIEKINIYFQAENEKINSLVGRLNWILSQQDIKVEYFKELLFIHASLEESGEKPDTDSLEIFAKKLSIHLIDSKQFIEFDKLVSDLLQVDGVEIEKWQRLSKINKLFFSESELFNEKLSSEIIGYAIAGEWERVLWTLLKVKVANAEDESEWWDRIMPEIRGATRAGNVIYPHLALQELLDLLIKKSKDLSKEKLKIDRILFREIEKGIKGIDEIIDKLTGYIFAWKMNPAPKGYGLQYPFLSELEELNDIATSDISFKEKLEGVQVSISQPSLFIDEILKDWGKWENSDYQILRDKLPYILAWDPDLLRLINADYALEKVARWKSDVSSKPDKKDFLRIAKIGDELMVSIGKTEWLELIVKALRDLDNGVKAEDVIYQTPKIVEFLPWLSEVHSDNDYEMLALRNYYFELKNGNLDAARGVIRENTTNSFYAPYLGAIDTIEASIGLIKDRKYYYRFSELSAKDDEKDKLDLDNAVNFFVDWANELKNKGIRSAFNLLLENSALRDKWGIIDSIFTVSDEIIKDVSRVSSERDKILKLDTNETYQHSKSTKKILAVISDNEKMLRKCLDAWETQKINILKNKTDFNKIVTNFINDNSIETKDLESSLNDAIIEFSDIATRLRRFELLNTYGDEDWKEANNLLFELTSLSCREIPPIKIRRQWVIQLNIMSVGELSEKIATQNSLDVNHPLFTWLKKYKIPQPSPPPPSPPPPLPPPPPPSPPIWTWILVSVIVLLSICVLVYAIDDIKCKFDPSQCAAPSITPTETRKPKEDATQTPLPPTPPIPLVPTNTPVPEVPEQDDTQGTTSDARVSVLPEPCNSYWLLFQERDWDVYFDSISKLSGEEYNSLKELCHWSHTQRQRGLNIILNKAVDALEDGNQREARKIIEDVFGTELHNVSDDTLFNIIGKSLMVNTMCNLPYSHNLNNKTTGIFLQYSDWLVQSDELARNIFPRICGVEFADFKSQLEKSLVSSANFQGNIYITNAFVDASQISNECKLSALSTSLFFPLIPEIKNCFQYGEVGSDAIQVNSEKLSSINIDFCVSPENSVRDVSLGIVLSQINYSNGYAYVVLSGDAPAASLYSFQVDEVMGSTNKNVSGNDMYNSRISPNICQPVTISINNTGNLLFMGDENNIPKLFPIILVDELRLVPMQYGLIIPENTKLEINKIEIVKGEMP